MATPPPIRDLNQEVAPGAAEAAPNHASGGQSGPQSYIALAQQIFDQTMASAEDSLGAQSFRPLPRGDHDQELANRLESGYASTPPNPCSICLEEMLLEVESDTSLTQTTLCNHRFHRICLSQWTLGVRGSEPHTFCPVCRNDLATGEAVRTPSPVQVVGIRDGIDENDQRPIAFTRGLSSPNRRGQELDLSAI